MELAVPQADDDMVLARSIEQYLGTEVEPTSRPSSSTLKNGFCPSPTIAAAVLTIVISGLLPGAGAFTFNNPSEGDLITCKPINLTWTVGIPPYQLSITPSHPSGGPVTDPWAWDLTQDERNIPNTWFVWIPNFPAGLAANFDLVDSGTGSPVGGAQVVLLGTDTSCLPVTTTPSQPTSTLTTSKTASSQPSSASPQSSSPPPPPVTNAGVTTTGGTTTSDSSPRHAPTSDANTALPLPESQLTAGGSTAAASVLSNTGTLTSSSKGFSTGSRSTDSPTDSPGAPEGPPAPGPTSSDPLTPQSAPATTPSGSHSLSKGAIVGIAVGVSVLVAAAAIVAARRCLRGRGKQGYQDPEPFVARKDQPHSREPGPPLSVVGSPESDVEVLKVPSHADEEAMRPNDASVRVEIGDYVPPPDPIAAASLPHEGGRRKVAQDRLPTNVGTTTALAHAATGAPTGPSTSVGRAALPQRRAPRFEMDGGVRLAGGALDEEVPDDIDALSDATTTLPPPYSRFYQS